MSDLRDKIVESLTEFAAQNTFYSMSISVDMMPRAADAVLAVIDLDKVRAEAFEAGVRSAVDAVNCTPPSNLKPYLRGVEQ